MYLLGIILVLSCFGAVVHGAGRVVGGTVAPDDKYPYQVSLRNAKNYADYLCSGSIINEYWILTAAHCIIGRAPKDLVISAGTNYLDVDGDVYKPTDLIHHDKYLSVYYYDIGLIRLEKKIVFNERVQPIRLPDKDLPDLSLSAMFAGWGRTQYDEPVSNELLEIELRVLPVETCSMSVRYFNRTSHICTHKKINEGICLGDSGGPLTVGVYQVGIASYVSSCAEGFPDVFTRVFAYKDWINKKINPYNIFG